MVQTHLFDNPADETSAEPQAPMMARTAAPLGPSDSSDSGSDVAGQALSGDGDPSEPVDVATGPDSRRPASDIESGNSGDTDAAGTGERRSAGNDAGEPEANDVAPDRIFEEPGEDVPDDPDDGLFDDDAGSARA